MTKRPSIEELLEDPLVANRRAKLERKTSGQQHSSSDLRAWEMELRALERELDEKKRELESKSSFFLPPKISITANMLCLILHTYFFIHISLLKCPLLTQLCNIIVLV